MATLEAAAAAAGGDGAGGAGAGKLVVRLPYLPLQSVLDRMAAERPHALGDLKLSSGFLDLEV